MLTGATLTAKEFSQVHNALCALDRINKKKVDREVEVIRKAFRSSYKDESDLLDERMDNRDELREKHGFQTIWSMYEVEDMNADHGFQDHKTVVLAAYWSEDGKEKAISVPIEGKSWLDLWRAADKAIVLSGDLHHCFIEGFGLKDGKLIIYTGS